MPGPAEVKGGERTTRKATRVTVETGGADSRGEATSGLEPSLPVHCGLGEWLARL